jgi:hypothetical protein
MMRWEYSVLKEVLKCHECGWSKASAQWAASGLTAGRGRPFSETSQTAADLHADRLDGP